MASQVNNTRVAQAACIVAIGAALYLNRGRIVTHFARGLGNGAIALVKRIQTAFSYRNTTDAPTQSIDAAKNPKKREYRMGYPGSPYLDDPRIHQEALKEALDHVKKDYPEEYEKFLSQKFSSETEILEFFTKMCTVGCCSGIADSLFEKIIRKDSPSLVDSVLLLDSENIFYHQILHYLFVTEKANKTFSHSTVHFQNIDYLMRYREEHDDRVRIEEDNLSKIKSVGAPTEEETRIYQKLIELHKQRIKEVDAFLLGTEKRIAEFDAQCDKHLENLRKNHHFKTFLDSERFPITASPAQYREILETTMRTFPESKEFVGVIHIPNHIVSFQYGHQGYYLFDPMQSTKGLLGYSNAETFCEELSKHVFEDACQCKATGGKKKSQIQAISIEEREAAIKKAKQVRPHFSIRPLDNINPLYTSK